jgi:uncharacterized protein
MRNPFRYGGIVTGEYFADRTEEIKELQREIENTSRVFMVSPRRLGKTCLLHNLMGCLDPSRHVPAYIDLNAFPDLRSFASSVTSLTTKALESNTEKVLKLFSALKRLRPKLKLGPEGEVSASLEVAADEKEVLAALIEGLAHADALAAKKNKTLAIIIDEFSDIEKYNGGTVEKAMRSEIQKHQHTSYIFSGSEPSVMLSMVRDKKRAFYKMGRIMVLEPIKQKIYEDFITGWFEKGGYTISPENVRRLLHLGGNVTYNVQRLCHTAWETAIESKIIDATLIKRLPLLIVKQDEPHYETIWQIVSPAQRSLLIALTQEPDAQPFSKEFQFRHQIGPSSSIKASLVSLIKKGVLIKTVQGGKYQFVDLFMPYWIEAIRKSHSKT